LPLGEVLASLGAVVEADDYGGGRAGSLPGAAPLADFSRTRAELDRWRSGDQDAFESLWRRYRPALEILIARRIRGIHSAGVRSRIEVEDILQDTGLVVHQHLAQFEYLGPGSLFAWMQVIAAHQVQDSMDRWSAQKRDPLRERTAGAGRDDQAGSALQVRDPGPGPSTAVSLEEERDRVRRAVAELPEREHRLVMLRQYFGAEWAEIARELAAPSAEAVRKEHARLLAHLGRLLGGT
jgi:RNA polymerase sigma-70 factor (ECF subfamily)